MKNIKKVTSVLLAVLMLMSMFPLASFAVTPGGTAQVTGTNSYISGFYYRFNGNFGTGKYGQHQMLRADGNMAYCIEPGKNLTAGTKSVVESYYGLSDTQQRLMTRAFIYGYNGFLRYGYDSPTEYVATQAIIWAISLGAFNNPGNESILLDCAFGGSTSSANRANGIDVYNKIKEQILSHDTVPSFTSSFRTGAVPEIKLTYNGATRQYEGRITDTNGVLANYSFSADGIHFVKDGNDLCIFTSREMKSNVISGKRTSNKYSTSLPSLAAVYCVGADQTTATAVNSDDPVQAFFLLTTDGRGTLEIHKHAEVGDAVGTVFNVNGNGVDMDVTIDSLYNSNILTDGYVRIENLPSGNYTVTEKNIQDKYYVTPSESQVVTVTSNNKVRVTFANNLRRGTIKITKRSEDGNVAGRTFAVIGGGKTEIVTTDSEGKVTISGALVGRYVVRELNCPSYMVQPTPAAFVLDTDETQTITIVNRYKRGSLVLSKVDADTGNVIIADDAVFEVSEYNKSTGEYDYVCNLTHSDSLSETLYGCTNGYYAENLPITANNEGKYRVTEKTAPSGYVADGAVYDVTITNNNEVIKVNDGTVVNKIQKAQIEILKTDNETGRALSGAAYDIYAKSDIFANGVLIASANTKVDTLVTGEDGKAVSEELYLGEYYLKEAEAPNGYVLDSASHDVSLTYDGQKSEVFVKSLNVSDTPQKATIEIVKKDAETGRLIVNPAKYSVYADEDIFVNGELKFSRDELVDTVTTSSGSGKSVPLYLGRYYIKEAVAPAGYNLNSAIKRVSLTYQDQSISVYNISAEEVDVSQKGKILITKTDSETNEPIKNLVSEFELYARNVVVVNGETIYNAGQLVATASTINGVAEFGGLPLGVYFVKEKTAPVGYAVDSNEHDVSLIYDSTKEAVSESVSISDVPQKGVITISKADAETGVPVSGAVYTVKAKADIKINGVVKYRAGQVVDKVTTDSHGKADTIPLYIGTYIVTEKSAPKPYTRDKNTYEVEVIPAEQTALVKSYRCSVTNLAQKGVIKISKTDSETGAPIGNAAFKIIAAEDIEINGVLKYHRNDVVCTDILTDELGVATSSELYLGKYKIVETTAPDGYVLNTDEILAELEYQGQEIEVFDAGYTVENAPQKGCIEIHKRDAETGLSLSSAVYEIYAAEDIFLNFDLKYSANTLVDTITTGDNGRAVSRPLYLGKYYVIEKNAPYGYVTDSERKEVALEYRGQDVSMFTVTIECTDAAQKGVISVSKYGEVLDNINNENGVYIPEYAVKPLEGAEFNIIAAEDIVTAEGTKRASEGEIVDTLTTGDDGIATSGELYLGKYKVVEKTAPYGMANNAEPQFVVLPYAGQNESLTFGNASFMNERQKATVEVEKVLKKDDLYNIGNNNEITNVKFGLYANENITAENGTFIPKDGLIEIATADTNGHIEFDSDIPIGKYYVKEVSTDKHYIPSDTKYPVEFSYAGQSVLAVRITVNNNSAISNDIVRGRITGHKIDDDGNAVAGATMGLFSTDISVFTTDTAYTVGVTDECGVFVFDNVPYGDYIVREIDAPDGYVLSEVSTPVSVTENAQSIEIEVLNSIVTGNLSIQKVDKYDKGKSLSGALFEIFVDVNANGVFDDDIDMQYTTITSNASGSYFCEGLRYNGYFLHEAKAPEGFVADNGYYYFEIRENGETVTVSNNDDGVSFENEPITGILEITKTDVSTGNLIPNAGFRIYNENGDIVEEGYTDENGVATFVLRYGKYKYQEFNPAPGYVLDDTAYDFEIKENGEVVRANMTNKPIVTVEIPKTGDEARGAVTGLICLSSLSLCGIFITRKKKRCEDK